MKMGLPEHYQALQVRHSSLVKDIAARGPRGNSFARSLAPSVVSKKIVERGPRSLKERIADSENSAFLHTAPASTQFFNGVITSWFRLAVSYADFTQDTLVAYRNVLYPENTKVRKQKKTDSGS